MVFGVVYKKCCVLYNSTYLLYNQFECSRGNKQNTIMNFATFLMYLLLTKNWSMPAEP